MWHGKTLGNTQKFAVLTGSPADKTMLYSRRVTRHDATKELANIIADNNLFFPITGHLTKADKTVPPEQGGPSTTFLVRSMSGTFEDLNRNLDFDAKTEKKRDYQLVAAVEVNNREDKDGQKGRAIVTADADVVSDLILDNSRGNEQFLMDSLRWLEHDSASTGQVDEPEDKKIVHTQDDDKLWFYGTVLGVPLLVLGAGVLVQILRRRKKEEVAA